MGHNRKTFATDLFETGLNGPTPLLHSYFLFVTLLAEDGGDRLLCSATLALLKLQQPDGSWPHWVGRPSQRGNFRVDGCFWMFLDSQIKY